MLTSPPDHKLKTIQYSTCSALDTGYYELQDRESELNVSTKAVLQSWIAILGTFITNWPRFPWTSTHICRHSFPHWDTVVATLIFQWDFFGAEWLHFCNEIFLTEKQSWYFHIDSLVGVTIHITCPIQNNNYNEEHRKRMIQNIPRYSHPLSIDSVTPQGSSANNQHNVRSFSLIWQKIFYDFMLII